MNWNKGDLAITVNCDSSEHNGFVVEVIGHHPKNKRNVLIFCEENRSSRFDGIWQIKPEKLAPIPPPDACGSWDESIFKPKELVTV